MRKLQYKKTCELLNTLQEAAAILSDMRDAAAKARLFSDMLFFVNHVMQYAENLTCEKPFVMELKELRDMLCSERECTEISEKISSIQQSLNTMEIERTAVNEFHAETDFSRYIDLLLQAMEDGYSIIIASMDTPCGSRRFTSELGEKLQLLGLDVNLYNKWRASYCAVIDDGNRIGEKISGAHSVSIACTLGKSEVFVKSAGMQKADSPRMCSVLINGQECTFMTTGIAFVIYDKERDIVVDSVTFNTFSEDLDASCPGILPALKEFMDKNPGVAFIDVRYPSFPTEHLSKNEKWILDEGIHYTAFCKNPMLPSPLSLYIKEPSGILEVLTPRRSYIGVDGARHFEEYEGKYLNIMNGHRRTLWQPNNFKRTIYVLGDCHTFGIGVRDEGTLASQLQKLLNQHAPEDKSYFPFADRIRLVREGCSDLENVCVVGSGKFILSSLTFSEYFNKSELQDRLVDSSEDVTLFVNEIAPAANIRVRFAGTEPFDTVTNQYNRTLDRILSQHGICFEKVPRLEKHGVAISASRVRQLAEERDWDSVQELAPDTTLLYLRGVCEKNSVKADLL